MLYTYQTERLMLKILNESDAGQVIDFYLRNHDHFAPWEEAHPAEYYTVDYQRKMLAFEMREFLRSHFVRYYLFTKESETLIGTISFRDITPSSDFSCRIGYRLDKPFTGQGLMTEAFRFMIPKIFFHYQLHRMEADVLPENTASLRLLKRLGFTEEGISRGLYRINGVYRDHLRYSLLSDDANFTSIYQ